MTVQRLFLLLGVAAMPALLSGCSSGAPTGNEAASAPAAAADPAAEAKQAIELAVASPLRSEANRARDPYRHPAETLEFFGLRPDMTVVEVAPGGGWYTEILAPVLKDNGKLIAAFNNPDASEGAKKAWDTYAAFLGEHQAQFGTVEMVPFGKGASGSIAPAGTVDMVLTFRNSHDFRNGGWGDEAFHAFFDVLKPGGVLGLVDHRLPEDMAETEKTRKDSYIKESDVIKMAEDAGFRLDAKSEINANPKDTHNWPNGVFSLPPTLREGDKDRDQYLAVGESDRMTLRFVKPAS